MQSSISITLAIAWCFITTFSFINGRHLLAFCLPPVLVIFVKQNFPIDFKHLEHSNSWCCHAIICDVCFFILTTGNGGWSVAWWSRETSVSPVTCEPQLAMHKCSSGDRIRITSFVHVGIFEVNERVYAEICLRKQKRLKNFRLYLVADLLSKIVR
jgi:hypothetical protein